MSDLQGGVRCAFHFHRRFMFCAIDLFTPGFGTQRTILAMNLESPEQQMTCCHFVNQGIEPLDEQELTIWSLTTDVYFSVGRDLMRIGNNGCHRYCRLLECRIPGWPESPHADVRVMLEKLPTAGHYEYLTPAATCCPRLASMNDAFLQAAKSLSRTGSRRAPQVPAFASNTPESGVAQREQRPSAVRFHAVMTYQSRPISLSPHS